jgi:hypothetical protein
MLEGLVILNRGERRENRAVRYISMVYDNSVHGCVVYYISTREDSEVGNTTIVYSNSIKTLHKRKSMLLPKWTFARRATQN